MYLIFLGTLKISVCTIVYPLQNCIKYYRQKKKKKKKKKSIKVRTIVVFTMQLLRRKDFNNPVQFLEQENSIHLFLSQKQPYVN